jgi:hypothetical protein
MVHPWLKATDGSGAAFCVVLFDYEKAFNLTDHNLLVQKIFNLYQFPVVLHTGELTF